MIRISLGHEEENPLRFVKMQFITEIGFFASVDKFLAAKALNFNEIQQTSTSRQQAFQ
jgi:hypothetical protein